MRLIDAHKLYEQYETDMRELVKSTNCENIGLEALSLLCGAKLIADAPTVDAAPVKHGQWVGDETCEAYDICGVKTWAVKRRCSACGFTHKFIEAHMYYDFCPKCSAKMDLEGLDLCTQS